MPTVTVNGYELFYANDDFAEPWRPHDTILMQHYVFGDHTQFRAWVPILAREYRVIRMDRRGNGRSTKPPLGYQYNLKDILSDFVGFLDALGQEKVHYIGDSLGGVLGAAFAATHPERVKSLVLCGTPCWIKPVTQKSFAREGYPDGPAAVLAMGSWAYAHSAWLGNRPAKATLKDDLKAIYRAQQQSLTPAHVIASLMRMVSQRSFDITPILPKIKAPTLLLTPEKSVHTSMEEQSMMKRRIPNCEQVVFKGAAHSISMDVPDRCAEEALKFIRRHSS